MSDCSPPAEKFDGSSEEPCCGAPWFASGNSPRPWRRECREEEDGLQTTNIGQSSPILCKLDGKWCGTVENHVNILVESDKSRAMKFQPMRTTDFKSRLCSRCSSFAGHAGTPKNRLIVKRHPHWRTRAASLGVLKVGIEVALLPVPAYKERSDAELRQHPYSVF